MNARIDLGLAELEKEPDLTDEYRAKVKELRARIANGEDISEIDTWAITLTLILPPREVLEKTETVEAMDTIER